MPTVGCGVYAFEGVRVSSCRALAARLRGIAASLPVGRLQRAAELAEAAAGHLLVAQQGSNDTALTESARALREAASTMTASARRLREAAAWIESYCTDILGIAPAASGAAVAPPDRPAEPRDESRTKPSGSPAPNAKPSGYPTRIAPTDEEETVRAITREHESAVILARQGYRVEQRPQVTGSKRPDYRIEGRIFDNYAPSTGRARNIAWEMAGKVKKKQADRIVLNLRDSSVDLAAMKTQLTDWPIPGLREVIVIDKNDTVIDFFP